MQAGMEEASSAESDLSFSILQVLREKKTASRSENPSQPLEGVRVDMKCDAGSQQQPAVGREAFDEHRVVKKVLDEQEQFLQAEIDRVSNEVPTSQPTPVTWDARLQPQDERLSNGAHQSSINGAVHLEDVSSSVSHASAMHSKSAQDLTSWRMPDALYCSR